jgi:hypothetical protein
LNDGLWSETAIMDAVMKKLVGAVFMQQELKEREQ